MTGTTRSNVFQEYDGHYWEQDTRKHRSKNLYAPEGVHIMNKNESSTLRRLKKETGLSEEEIRKVKKYRVILSTAQKECGPKNETDTRIYNVVKYLTKETKLPVEHPEFKNKLKEYLEKHPLKDRFMIGELSSRVIISRFLSIRKDQKERNKKKK